MSAPSGFVKIRSAVVSVSDKSGLVEFAMELEKFGVEMLATGGTFALLKDAGVGVKSLETDADLPSAISGRVKTLHAPLHAAILAQGSDEHLRELKAMGMKPVDAVICNFYPFREVVGRKGVTDEVAVESIDVGGPTMVRAASKNFARVVVVPAPSYYPEVMQEMKRTGGGTSLEFRRRMAVEAFSLTSAYDAAIFDGLGRADTGTFPRRFIISASKDQDAKYGENPDRRASVYSLDGWRTMTGWRLLAGDAMSFNNFLDVGSARSIMDGLEGVAAAATVKHGQVSGFAFAPTVAEAYALAHSCDPEADFGGCVITNREVDASSARLVGRNEGKNDGSVYTEIVVAPSFSPEAVDILKAKQKKKIRLVQADFRPDYPYDVRLVEGALLVQEAVDYRKKLGRSAVTVPTRKKPDEAELLKLMAAWELVRKVQSNGIVIADGVVEGGGLNRFWTLGVGTFRKRNGAVKIALDNAGPRAKGAVCASDGFFPFRDSVDLLGAAGVSSIVQPGGSARDEEVIRAADERGISMAFTHTRAFKH